MEITDRYKLSIRIRHPSLDPDTISARLGLKPVRQWGVGSARATATGHPLEGVHTSTYWSCEVSAGHGSALIEALRGFSTEMSNHDKFLHELRDSGGDVEYF